MALPLRAIYQDGQLRLLDPVELQNGQEVEVIIQPALPDDRLRQILGDRVRWPDAHDNRHAELESRLEEIAQALGGGKSGSTMIDEDRGDL